MTYTPEERRAARMQLYRQKNAAKANAASRLWRKNHPEHAKALRDAWGASNPEKVKEHARRCRLRKYGLTEETRYEKRVCEQKGLCAICLRRKTRLVVDHCHRSQRVRGLLCTSCNMAIGLLQDDPTTLLSAAKYLGEFV